MRLKENTLVSVIEDIAWDVLAEIKNGKQRVTADDVENQDVLYIRNIIRQELGSFLDDLKKAQDEKRRHKSGCSYKDILNAIKTIELAQKAKLHDPKA